MKKFIAIILCMGIMLSVGSVSYVSAFAAEEQSIVYTTDNDTCADNDCVVESVSPMAYNPSDEEYEKSGFSKFMEGFGEFISTFIIVMFDAVLRLLGIDIGDSFEV